MLWRKSFFGNLAEVFKVGCELIGDPYTCYQSTIGFLYEDWPLIKRMKMIILCVPRHKDSLGVENICFPPLE